MNNDFIIPFFVTFLAGASTVLGGLVVLFHLVRKEKYIGYFLGFSAGVMVYLSFIELLPFATKTLGILNSNILFFTGIGLTAIVDFMIPYHYLESKFQDKHGAVDRTLLSTGFVATLGLALHNFPEGVSVFLSSYTDIRLGILLAIAIAIHNIPEGIAIATSIYHATRNTRKTLIYTAISALAEPFGAMIAYFFLRPYLSQNLLAYLFALVAGVMIYISFDELLPACFRCGRGHTTILGIVSGMIVAFVSLLFL